MRFAMRKRGGILERFAWSGERGMCRAERGILCRFTVETRRVAGLATRVKNRA
jgi:hypothetical protein